MKNFIRLIISIMIISEVSYAQVAEYYFTQQNLSYTEITGGTSLWSGTFDNEVSGEITIPSFTFNGTVYTSLYISANGFITFGSAPTATNYTPISNTATYNGAVSGFGRDLNQAATGSPAVRYEQVGNEFVIQWKDVRRKDIASEVISFQIRLNTSNNYIQIVYGGTITPGANATYPQVGLRGPDNTFATSVNNRSIAVAGGNWINSTKGTNNSSTMYFNSATPATVPTAGLTFTWKPLYNPTDFTAEAISQNQVDLDWLKNSLNHNVMVAWNTSTTFGTPNHGETYSVGNTIGGNGTVLFYGDGTSCSHASLSANTRYYYKIWSFDAVPDYSIGDTVSTRTAMALPYLQDFNGTSAAGWSYNMALTTNHGTAGTKGLAENLSSGSAYAITPLIGSMTASTNLSFHYRIVNALGFPLNATTLGPSDKIDIQVSLNDGATFTTFHTIDQNNHTTSTEFANKVLSLAAYNGDFIKIRFLCTWGSGDYWVDIDNVLFEDGTNMSYSAATTEQLNTTNVAVNSTDNEIIRLQVVTQKSSNPLSVTSITFNTTGCTNAGTDLAAAKVYYTTTPVFSTATLFGTLATPSGTFSITGTQALAQGNNYFWLAYDIKPTATLTNLVDAQCTKFITSDAGTDKIPTATNPAGSRKIGAVISSPKSIPTDYATIALAVTALNNGLIGSGGVTFNVAAGHTESSTAAILLTQTGTSANPIIFQKSGEGANPIVTHSGAGSVTTNTLGYNGDGVIIIEGSDYVTFDAIDVTATNSGVEYGYYLRKASFTNGCKNVTVKNANITMTKGTTKVVVGFCAANNSSSGSNIAITTTGGIHEAITFTGNLISNTFCGIYLKGSDDFKDQNFIIGASGFGNTIQNFGGNSANATYGIYIENNDNPLLKYNTINNMTGGGSAFTAAATGIYHAGTGLEGFTAEYNNINLTSTSASALLYGIYSSVFGVLQLNYNTIALSNTTSSTGVYAFIYNYQTSTTTSNNIYITNNTFAAGNFQTTGDTYLIYNTNTRLQPSVTNIQNNATSGTISRTGTSGSFWLYNNASGTGTGIENISGNNFSNISLAGSTSFQGIRSTTNASHTQNIYNNTISNITGGSGNFYAIYVTSANNRSIYGNEIYNITGGGNMIGIYLGNGSNPGHIYNNELYNLSTSSTSASAGVINGIEIATGKNVYLFNNFISDLKTPASTSYDAIRGIAITSGEINGTIGVYYNSIYLNATSSGASFGTTGIYHYANTDPNFAKLDLRNNLIINNSTPNGSASIVAFRRSAQATDNYAATSNNNIFYAGTPASNKLIYWGNTTKQTMEEYRDFIGPNRDSVSFSELPPFIDIASAPYDLRLQDGAATYCESGAQPITSPVTISVDFDGASRPATPDIGADEFAGIPAYVEKPQSFNASSYNSRQIKLDFTGNSYDDDIVIIYNLTGIFTDPSGTPVVSQPLAGGTVLYIGTASPFIHTGLTPGITVYYKIFSYNVPFYSIGRNANAVPLVLPVTNLSATEASQTQIDLSWTKNASNHDVMIALYISPNMGTPANGTSYDVGNSIPGGGTVIYKGPASGYNHTGLTQWTQYYYRAWSFDAYNYYSVFAPKNTVTDSDPATLPYLQNFDGAWAHNPEEPPAWRVIDADGGGMNWMRSTTSPHSSPASARGYEYLEANDYLISPPLVLPDTAIQMTWWDITTNSSLNSYKVLLSTTNKAVSSFTVELGDYNCTNNTWEQRSLSLGAYNNQTVYIAFFQYYSTASGENFRIDDVFIETRLPGPATNPLPSDGLLTMVNPTLKWTAPLTSFPILGYKVYHGTTSNPSTLIYDGTGPTFQMGDLDYNSTYYWKVVPYNSYGEAMNVPVWSFTTVTSTQLAESFEGESFPPAGWSYKNGWSGSTTASYHGIQSARGTTFNEPLWRPFLITPLLEIVSGDNLEFFERATSATFFNYFRIYYSDDKVDWIEFGSPYDLTRAAWGHQVIDLTALAGNNYYLAIEAWSPPGNFDYIYIDHVTGPDVVPVLPAPATNPDPDDLADYISVTPTLGWGDGSNGGIPTGYKVYLDMNPNPTTLIYDGSDPYYQTSTLLNDTTYYWKVVPYNIVGDAPDCPVWSFTTIPELATQIGFDNEIYYSLPIAPSTDYSYTQTIYLQSEIDIPASRIYKIYYEFSGGGGIETAMGMSDADSPFKDWVIYMGHTDKSSFTSDTDWIPFEDLTEVFNGEITMPEYNGWIEITLDMPFEYDNIDNLVIAVDENTPGAASPESCYFFGTDTPFVRGLAAEDYAVNPDPADPPAAGGMVEGFANIRIEMEGIPTVPIFKVNPTSKNFGYIVLESESNPQTFTIRNNGVGTITINNVDITGTDDDQFQLTDLNSYPVYLDAYESIVVNVTFSPTTEGLKTASLSIAHSLAGSPAELPLSGNGLDPVIDDFPFTETFEDDSPFRVLWTQIQVAGSGLWTYEAGSHFYSFINEAHGGLLNARFTNTPDGNITKLVSPVFDLTAVTDPHLVFWYGQEFMDPYQNELKVYYRTASDQPWIEIFSDNQDKYQWTPKVLALPSPSATYQLAFEGIDNYGFANVLDDITVGPPPEPEITFDPTEYDFGNVLTGTESYQQTFTIINLGPVLLTIDNVDINGTDEDDFIKEDLNSYPVELDYGEWIEVYVSFYPGSEGAKTAILEITDDATGSPHQASLSGIGLNATITTFPFTETFENDSPSRDFWTQIQEYGTGLWTYANGAGGGSITDAHNGVLNARFTDIGDGDLTKLVSPVFDLTSVTNPQVEFWYGQEAWEGDQNELYVYYRIASDQPWVDLFYDDTEKSQWTLQSLLLPNKSATYQIAFEGYDAYGYANVLDDITVNSFVSSETTWTGNVSSNWLDPDNWSDGVPTVDHAVYIATEMYDPVIETTVTVFSIDLDEFSTLLVSPPGSLTVTGN